MTSASSDSNVLHNKYSKEQSVSWLFLCFHQKSKKLNQRKHPLLTCRNSLILQLQPDSRHLWAWRKHQLHSCSQTEYLQKRDMKEQGQHTKATRSRVAPNCTATKTRRVMTYTENHIWTSNTYHRHKGIHLEVYHMIKHHDFILSEHNTTTCIRNGDAVNPR